MVDAFSRAMRESIKPSQIDVFTPMGYTPHDRQKVFHNLSSDRVYSILFGGSRGGGKSAACTMDAIHNAVNFPGMRIGCVRKTYVELEQSFIPELAKRGFAETFGARWNGTDHALRFPNGSRIDFTYAANDQDAAHLLGGEYQAFYVDEAGQIPESVLHTMEENLRSGSRGLPVIGMRLACVDEGDVLTATGWKPIQDVATGELVYSVNAEGKLELKPVIDVFKGYTEDPLVRVRTRGLYMSMTQDHRVVYQDESNPRIDHSIAEKRYRHVDPTYRIVRWNEHTKRTISVARAPLTWSGDGDVQNPLGWKTDHYLAFMGLFLAEGSTNTVPLHSNYKTIITQCQVENQPEVQRLFEALPYNFNLSANGDFQITNKKVWTYFREFGKSHEKFVPRTILDHATKDQLELLWKWMVFGDGHIVPSLDTTRYSIEYVTVSPQLADDVCEIAIKLGHKVHVTRTVLDNPNHRDRYDVHVVVGGLPTSRVQKNTHLNHTNTEPFKGMVYCIKVADNENFVLRQHGTVWLSGNTNPGGISHNFLKETYIKPTKKGTVLHTALDGRRYAYVPSKYSDNPFIDRGYETILNGIEDPQRRAAMRDGDWDAMVGAFFEQWSPARHIVPYFELPAHWQRYCGIDWGFDSPWAVVWGAIDPDSGRLYIYREKYLTKVPNTVQAELILQEEHFAKETDVIRMADPSMWGNRGTPMSIADQYGLAGCGIAPADNERINGWAMVHNYLNDGPPCDYHRSLDKPWDSCPMLHVLDGTCANFIETIPSLPRNLTKPDDAATTNVADHMPDALRYMCMHIGAHARPIFYDDSPGPSIRDVQKMNEELQAAYSTTGFVMGRYGGSLALDR